MMQVMPFWKNEIGRPEDNLINPKPICATAAPFLNIISTREQGRLADALARYNGSYGQYWYAELVLDSLGRALALSNL